MRSHPAQKKPIAGAGQDGDASLGIVVKRSECKVKRTAGRRRLGRRDVAGRARQQANAHTRLPGVSPSQASPATILKVDLYGTALVLEEFGNVIIGAPRWTEEMDIKRSGSQPSQKGPESLLRGTCEKIS